MPKVRLGRFAKRSWPVCFGIPYCSFAYGTIRNKIACEVNMGWRLTVCGLVFLQGACLAADVKVAGRVVDSLSGAGVAGATVGFSGVVMGRDPDHHRAID